LGAGGRAFKSPRPDQWIKRPSRDQECFRRFDRLYPGSASEIQDFGKLATDGDVRRNHAAFSEGRRQDCWPKQFPRLWRARSRPDPRQYRKGRRAQERGLASAECRSQRWKAEAISARAPGLRQSEPAIVERSGGMQTSLGRHIARAREAAGRGIVKFRAARSTSMPRSE
jgi:hypothetical protein